MEVKEPKTVYHATGLDKANPTKSNLRFVFNLTMGKIAECLIQELFLLEGYQVYKYGMENNYPHLYKQISFDQSETSKAIKYSPDLVINDPTIQEGGLYFAEVKFCSTDTFDLDQAKYQHHAQSFPNCYFFIVNPSNIYAISFEALYDKGSLPLLHDSDFLLNDKGNPFRLKPDTVQEIEKFAAHFYNQELISFSKLVNATYRAYR